MRTGIITSTASAASAVIAHWQMSLSPARTTPCSAMTATVMSSPPSVWPATRSSCQVKAQGSLAWRNSGVPFMPFLISVFPRREE